MANAKWSVKDHPAYQKTAPQSPVEETSAAATTFAVNDMVLAKWHSGDKGFYPARITSITGSSTAPVYIVKFKGYDTTETLRSKDIKPIVNPNKRKADGPPDMTPSAPQINTNVISAAADINEELAQRSKKEPSKVGDGPTRPAKVPKKIKNKTELETGKKNWQEFASKGKFGKAAKKDSMFRTPEGVNGRGKHIETRMLVCNMLTISQLVSLDRVRACAKTPHEAGIYTALTRTRNISDTAILILSRKGSIQLWEGSGFSFASLVPHSSLCSGWRLTGAFEGSCRETTTPRCCVWD